RTGRAAARLQGRALDLASAARLGSNADVEVPILKQGQFLIATIQAALTDADLMQLRSALVHQVVRLRSLGVIVDVTAMDVVDSFASRTLLEISRMIRLRGADTVIVGIQPEVAFAMVQLGLTLEDIPTSLDLEEGLAYLQQKFSGTN
ncbi:MAG TPA: STAS domain-containing protein, partial [Steroidobacteraceae bacterium]